MYNFDTNKGIWNDIPRPAQFGIGNLGGIVLQHILTAKITSEIGCLQLVSFSNNYVLLLKYEATMKNLIDH